MQLRRATFLADRFPLFPSCLIYFGPTYFAMNTDTDTSRRPSLYSYSGSSSEKAEAFSLLDVGEHGRSGILRGHRLAIGLLALTLLAMGMALVRLGAPRVPSWVGEAASSRREATPPSAAPPVVSQATANGTASSEAPLATGASIMVEPAATAAAAVPAIATAVVPGDAAAPVIMGPDAVTTDNTSLSAPLPTAAGSEGGNPHPATASEGEQAAKPVPAATPSKKAAASTQHASGAATPAARPAPHHATHAHRKPSHGKGSRKEDSDVDLIAALLSRVSHADKAGASAVRRAAGNGANAPAKGKVDDQNRDIVMPRQNESLAHLVQRCRALGVVEGELCRIRICSGNWGKDPACPVTPEAPSN